MRRVNQNASRAARRSQRFAETSARVSLTTPAHPLPIGADIVVYRVSPTSPPIIEGRAEIIAPILNIANVYDVRFVGERTLLRRLVHPGAWQSDPRGMLVALIDHWRVAIAPEILAPDQSSGFSRVESASTQGDRS